VRAPLAPRVRGEQPEEPGQRRRRRVLPGEHEGDDHVPQEPELGRWRGEHGAELAAAVVVHGRHEPRQQVRAPVVDAVPVTRRRLRFDDGHGVGVDDMDGLPEPARLANVEELGEPPPLQESC